MLGIGAFFGFGMMEKEIENEIEMFVAGLVLDPLTKRQVFRFGFHFGLFQALLPLVGALLGTALLVWIAEADHWIAFALLVLAWARRWPTS